MSRTSVILARAATITVALLAASACGQKGPLTHPGKPAPASAPAAAVPAR